MLAENALHETGAERKTAELRQKRKTAFQVLVSRRPLCSEVDLLRSTETPQARRSRAQGEQDVYSEPSLTAGF